MVDGGDQAGGGFGGGEGNATAQCRAGSASQPTKQIDCQIGECVVTGVVKNGIEIG